MSKHRLSLGATRLYTQEDVEFYKMCCQCHLCDGLIIDAVTITECMHSFCRTCAVLHFNTKNNKCPTCNTVVHQGNPLLGIKLDRPKQEIIYKLFPGVHKKEMMARRAFYKEHPGIADEYPGAYEFDLFMEKLYSPVRLISFSLEYFQTLEPKLTEDSEYEEVDFPFSKIYLRVVEVMPVEVLRKVVTKTMKSKDDPTLDVLMFYRGNQLPLEASVCDVFAACQDPQQGDMAIHYAVFRKKPAPMDALQVHGSDEFNISSDKSEEPIRVKEIAQKSESVAPKVNKRKIVEISQETARDSESYVRPVCSNSTKSVIEILQTKDALVANCRIVNEEETSHVKDLSKATDGLSPITVECSDYSMDNKSIHINENVVAKQDPSKTKNYDSISMKSHRTSTESGTPQHVAVSNNIVAATPMMSTSTYRTTPQGNISEASGNEESVVAGHKQEVWVGKTPASARQVKSKRATASVLSQSIGKYCKTMERQQIKRRMATCIPLCRNLADADDDSSATFTDQSCDSPEVQSAVPSFKCWMVKDEDDADPMQNDKAAAELVKRFWVKRVSGSGLKSNGLTDTPNCEVSLPSKPDDHCASGSGMNSRTAENRKRKTERSTRPPKKGKKVNRKISYDSLRSDDDELPRNSASSDVPPNIKPSGHVDNLSNNRLYRQTRSNSNKQQHKLGVNKETTHFSHAQSPAVERTPEKKIVTTLKRSVSPRPVATVKPRFQSTSPPLATRSRANSKFLTPVEHPMKRQKTEGSKSVPVNGSLVGTPCTPNATKAAAASSSRGRTRQRKRAQPTRFQRELLFKNETEKLPISGTRSPVTRSSSGRLPS